MRSFAFAAIAAVAAASEEENYYHSTVAYAPDYYGGHAVAYNPPVPAVAVDHWSAPMPTPAGVAAISGSCNRIQRRWHS